MQAEEALWSGPLLLSTWSRKFINDALHGIDDLPKVSMRTLIGILMAISGNVLISLALNLQKLAHKRLEEKKNAIQDDYSNGTAPTETGEGHEVNESNDQDDVFSNGHAPQREAELLPLTLHAEPLIQNYGAGSSTSPTTSISPQKRSFISRLNPIRRKKTNFILPIDVISEEAALHGLTTIKKKSPPSQQEPDSDVVDDNEGDYLKSKLWWTGFLLMNVGETGNFVSYGFAPASMVAPLGTFALMANCFFAPLLLGEHFKKRDLFGVLTAIIGAITVVFSSNSSDIRLDRDALLVAVRQTPFIVFSCIYLAGALTLASLSELKVGQKHVVVDVGLCALFGGFTVLSTKGLSSLLTLEWMNVFTHWITYVLLLVLLLTGIGQIRYLNRALMRFDSKVVIPTQFVFFTISAITGSAVLYGDFQRARFHQVVTFLYGCAATFTGVFIIAWSPKEEPLDFPSEQSEDELEELAPIENPAQAAQEGARLGPAPLGRRQRATLVLPSGISPPTNSPVLGQKRSGIISTMGISPAQHLLLVHTPPRESLLRDRFEDDPDLERGNQSPSEPYNRRRTLSWYSQDAYRSRSATVARDSGSLGRQHGERIRRTTSQQPGSSTSTHRP